MHSSKLAYMSVIDSRFAAEKPRGRVAFENLAMRGIGRVAAGLRSTLGDRSRNCFGILMYHRVADHVRGLPAPLHNVTPARFRRQIAGLSRRGYNFWPLRKALEYHAAGETMPAKTVLVTFDDGFQTVYSRAFPVLKEFNVPATVFLNTAYLDSERPFPFDAWGVPYCKHAPDESYRPLTEGQCHEMTASGLVEIGAHTHTHEDFRGRADEFRQDLQVSVDIVRDAFKLDEVTFAFPYGGRHTGFSSDELGAAARQTGVLCGLTTESTVVRQGTDPFRWGRFNAFPWDTGATLHAKLSGWYSWAPKLRQSLARGLRRDSRQQDPRLVLDRAVR